MGRAVPMLATATALWAAAVHSDEPASLHTPEEIVEKAIAYHDPNGVWETGRIRLGVQTTYSAEFAERVGSRDVTLALTLAPGRGEFSYLKKMGTDNVEVTIVRDQSTVAVNGSASISDADRQRLRLGEAAMYRDYCEYLYGMPMKLRDPGTMLDPRVSRMHFNDRDTWRLKVTYPPEVGEHTWYFYFDIKTFALLGYRFYLDESKDDGEYITFDEEAVDRATKLRLPKIRSWYYNANDKHLATDDIVWISTAE